MSAPTIVAHDPSLDHAHARRFLVVFAACVIVIALLVATVNLVAFRFMLRADNQAIVQLLSGWGRMYKPVLHDEIRPNVVVFGASWARDAFDPIETGRLLGNKVFNHGVSGGTAYETLRFAQSALTNPELEAAIVNLDTFFRDRRVARFRYGFDESILNVAADGTPNRFVGLRRAYSLALTGWAAGANLELIAAILERDRGADRAEYLESYQRADLTRRRGQMDEARQRIFPERGGAKTTPDSPPSDVVDIPAELDTMIDGFCAAGVETHAYFTPFHVRSDECDARAQEELAMLGHLRAKRSACAAGIHLYSFNYPNAVTLEGLLEPVTAAEFYRPDGHPRPTVGLLMAARMFGRDYPPGTPAAVARDFGVELLSHPDAEGWLRTRFARCRGEWDDDGLVEMLKSPGPG